MVAQQARAKYCQRGTDACARERCAARRRCSRLRVLVEILRATDRRRWSGSVPWRDCDRSGDRRVDGLHGEGQSASCLRGPCLRWGRVDCDTRPASARGSLAAVGADGRVREAGGRPHHNVTLRDDPHHGLPDAHSSACCRARLQPTLRTDRARGRGAGFGASLDRRRRGAGATIHAADRAASASRAVQRRLDCRVSAAPLCAGPCRADRAVRLDRAAPARIFDQPVVAHPTGGDTTDTFHPSRIEIHEAGRWMLLARSGSSWGCIRVEVP